MVQDVIIIAISRVLSFCGVHAIAVQPCGFEFRRKLLAIRAKQYSDGSTVG